MADPNKQLEEPFSEEVGHLIDSIGTNLVGLSKSSIVSKNAEFSELLKRFDYLKNRLQNDFDLTKFSFGSLQSLVAKLTIADQNILKLTFVHSQTSTNNIKDLIQSAKQNIDEISLFNPEPYEYLERRVDELGLNLDNIHPIITNDFGKLQEESASIINKLNDNLSTLQTSTQNTLETITVNYEELRNKHIAVAEKDLEKLNKFVNDGEKISHFLSGRALSGYFSDRANEEKKAAKKWIYSTWGFAIGTLAALTIFFFFYSTPNGPINYSLIGTKVLFTATLGLIAKWSSKMANRHLAEESKYHRLAINMQTIDSFIATLDEPSKNSVLTAVALKIFTETNQNETPTEFDTASAIDVIKGLLIPKGEK